MRQPEVARSPLQALAAILLVLPVARAGWSLVLSLAFLAEFLSDGRVPALTRLTPPPAVTRVAMPGVAAERHAGPCWSDCSLVLIHGLTPVGYADPRLRRAARLLARTGFDVLTPTIEGLTRMTLRDADVEAVIATIGALPPPVRLVGISVGAGPAILAAADARVRDRVAAVLSLGGYASFPELVQFHLKKDPEIVRRFAEANPDLMDASARQALVTGTIEDLSPAVRRRLDTLSPETVVGRLRARLLIVHGRDDPVVPFTESLRLAAAARALRPRVVIIGAIAHVERQPAAARLVDLLKLAAVCYELIARR